MPHTLKRYQPAPYLKDRGVQVALLWLGAILVFNLTGAAHDQQLDGLVVGAPFLASALVDRSRRVITIGLIALLVLISGATAQDTASGTGELVQIVATVIATVVATWISATRIRARRRMVDVNEVSRSVQTAVMRLAEPETARATIALRYRAADVEALIGGDALEIVETKWGVRLLVADARGKGLGSLRASTLALGAFREWAHEEPELADLLMRLHTSLMRDLEEDDFVTALVAQLDDLCFTWATAGHPSPMLVRQQVLTELDDALTTPPLAMNVPHRAPRAASIDLMAGDVVLMCTDGLLEARDHAGQFFPIELEGSRCLAGPDVGEGVERLLAAASEHSAGAVKDDIGVAAIRIDDGHRATRRDTAPPLA